MRDIDPEMEPEFACIFCEDEAPGENELCAWCQARLDEGELVECGKCFEVCRADIGDCICGNPIRRPA